MSNRVRLKRCDKISIAALKCHEWVERKIRKGLLEFIYQVHNGYSTLFVWFYMDYSMLELAGVDEVAVDTQEERGSGKDGIN